MKNRKVLDDFIVFVEINFNTINTLSGIKNPPDLNPLMDFLRQQKELFIIKSESVSGK